MRTKTGMALTRRKHSSDSMKTFYQNIDLPEFKASLEAAPDPRYQMLLKAMMSPKHAKMSFSNLARKCQLTLRELNDVWRDHQMHAGMLRMLRHLPDVMEDVAEDSRTREYTCPDCGGTGRDREMAEKTDNINPNGLNICRMCRGDGHIREIGDAKSRDLLFEAAGMKKGAPLVNMNINTASAPSFEDTLKDISSAFDMGTASQTLVVSPPVAEPEKEVVRDVEPSDQLHQG